MMIQMEVEIGGFIYSEGPKEFDEFKDGRNYFIEKVEDLFYIDFEEPAINIPDFDIGVGFEVEDELIDYNDVKLTIFDASNSYQGKGFIKETY